MALHGAAQGARSFPASYLAVAGGPTLVCAARLTAVIRPRRGWRDPGTPRSAIKASEVVKPG